MNRDWWLKIQRAEKHMVDIQEEARRYAKSNPYEFIRTRLPDDHPQIVGYFHITEQPDPMIAIMLGDFIHNLRSALDWVVVACSPKSRRYDASFPIFPDDPFAKDINGNYMVSNSNQRDRFNSLIDGIHSEARASIIGLQPYQATNLLGFGANLHNLRVISRLENADKHRQIITLGEGGQDFFLHFIFPGFPLSIPFKEPLGTGTQYLKDNTEIRWNLPPGGFPPIDGSPIKPSEVDVHLVGTMKILVQVAGMRGMQPSDNFLLDGILGDISDVREILTKLEFFALRN